jgi:uncharacterized protein YyaL (SSP411 family)
VPNRLAAETSPYLRQHADNPVNWFAWDEEAFARAREDQKPIFLSIGYSACHWCHVMAHESFEHRDVADALNSGFVSIKVDREERPDVDSIYMEAVQTLTGGGGWPMSVFLLPDGRPFHGGTYFPRPRFLQLLDRIREMWYSERPVLEEGASRLADAVRRGTSLPGRAWAAGSGPEPKDGGKAAASAELLEVTADALLARYDPEWGGFGQAPKFPQPPMLETLLLGSATTGRNDLTQAITNTLDAMASGGIYDHLGGGFARYSTDRMWLVPHFEKMLYDNALLARVYLHAWQVTGLERYRQVVTETLEYLLFPPMRIDGAGLASAEDADSEGVEGRFYVWSHDEVVAVGGPDAAEWYGVTARGNWEGANILWRPRRGEMTRPPHIEEARRALLDRRNQRARPGLDDKVLTEWNAMAIAALAEAGAVLGQPRWLSEAQSLGAFLIDQLRRDDGRWLRSWQGGKARHLGYASDYVWLVEAFTRLAEATGQAGWIFQARQSADNLIELFWDQNINAFATTGLDAEALIARPVDTQDGALPAANSVAATALIRLSALTGDGSYRDRATAVLESMNAALSAAPVAFTGLVAAAYLAGTPMTEVVVTGERPDLLGAYRSRYLPDSVLAWGQAYDSPLWEGRTGPELEGLAFVCRNYTCRAPVSEASQLAAELATIHPSGPQTGHYL